MKRKLLWACVALPLCALSSLAAGSAVAASGPTLTGRPWLLTTLAGVDRRSAGITATFSSSGKVSGFSGCNTYSGTYTTSGSSIDIPDKIAVTMMACRRAVMLQESAFLKALTFAQTYSLAGGKLTLVGRRNRVLASFAPQSLSLAGTRWNVISYNNGKQAVVSVMAETKLTAEFSANDVSGFAGCNSYSGTYTSTPPKIAFGPLGATKKACGSPQGVMEQENAYLTALATAATYELQGPSLELRTAGGAIAATMQRA